MRETLDIENLSCDAVDSVPLNVSWSERLGEDLEGWRAYSAEECEGCGEVIVISTIGGEEYCPECEHEQYEDGPAMNYFYPVQINDVEKASKAVADWPVYVVEFEDGETGLALAGGGMDLSWEICGAFIALGYLPPVHFCRLPRMAGWEAEAWRVPIMRAAIEACQVAERWAASKRKDVVEMLNVTKALHTLKESAPCLVD